LYSVVLRHDEWEGILPLPRTPLLVILLVHLVAFRLAPLQVPRLRLVVALRVLYLPQWFAPSFVVVFFAGIVIVGAVVVVVVAVLC
jgi:hypothetical protein